MKGMDIRLSNLQVAVIYFKTHHFLRGSKPPVSFVIPHSFKVLLCWAEYKVTLNLRHTTHTPAHVLSRAKRRTNYAKISSKYSDLPRPMAVHAVSSSAHAVLPSCPLLPMPRLPGSAPFPAQHRVLYAEFLVAPRPCNKARLGLWFLLLLHDRSNICKQPNADSIPTFQMTPCPCPSMQ